MKNTVLILAYLYSSLYQTLSEYQGFITLRFYEMMRERKLWIGKLT